jgi:hypothetical protein
MNGNEIIFPVFYGRRFFYAAAATAAVARKLAICRFYEM